MNKLVFILGKTGLDNLKRKLSDLISWTLPLISKFFLVIIQKVAKAVLRLPH